MGGKSQTSTTNTANTYTPTALPQLQDIFNRAQQAASTPYQPYTGQMVAGLSPTQQAGIANVNAAYGTAQPYINTAANYATQGASGITPSQIAAYSNPFQKMVTDATLANINEVNAQQQQQLRGNAALQGALGGDRLGVAQAELARQQGLANNQTLAGLNQQNYTQALGAAQADRAAAAQGAYTFGNLGGLSQNAALQGAQAQIGAGGLEQQTQQNQLSAAYNQYLQQLAFPYQQAQFLASVGLPAAQAMGGSQQGQSQTTTPGPSLFGQIAGLGLTGVGLAGATGGLGSGGWLTNAFGGGAGGGTGYSTNPWSSGGVAGPWGAQGPNQAPFYYSRGGVVIDTERDPNGIYVPRGYAEGGDVDNPLSFNDRWAGMATGNGGAPFGNAQEARDAIAAVTNNGDPGTAAWRAGAGLGAMPVETPADDGMTASAVPMSYAPQAGGMAGGLGSAGPGMPPVAAPPAGLPAVQSAAAPQSGGLSDDARMSLIAAGLGMMASKSPFALSQIGEGGLAGVKAYTDLSKTRQAQAVQQQRVDLEAQRMANQVEQFAKTHGLDEAKLKELQRQRDIQQYQPVKVGTDALGREVYGIRSPADGAIRIIDPKSGALLKPGETLPGTPGGATGMGAGNDEGALPPKAMPVSGENTMRNEEYLKTLNDIEPTLPNLVKKIADYDLDPRTLSNKGGYRERVLGMVAKYDPSYSAPMYPARAAAVKEFLSGGPNSPAGNITSGNTAIQHLGQLAALSEKIGGTNNAWILNKPVNWFNEHQKEWQNDPVLRQYKSALERYAEEATKFYRGTGGSLTDVERSIGNLTAGQSPESRAAAIQQESELMNSKISALQDRWKTAMGGPTGLQAALKRAGIEDFPITQQKSQAALHQIEELYKRRGLPAPAGGTPAAAKPARVRQNGHTFELQPDGNYKAID